jgi:hypothetical protein
MAKESSKYLILTMSLGDSRNYINLTYPYLKRYADRCGADFLVLDNDNSDFIQKKFQDISSGRKGGGNCYILKAYVIYHFLEKYEKVLWLDDTCIIKKHTDNLFDFVPAGSIGGYNEGEIESFRSWKYDKEFIAEHTQFYINERNYLNSGVVLYTRECRDLFSPESIYEHHELFQSKYPHQAFLNYSIQVNKIPLVLFDKKFNTLLVCCEYDKKGQRMKGCDLCEEKIVLDSGCIYHITGFYNSRYELLERLNEMFTLRDL